MNTPLHIAIDICNYPAQAAAFFDPKIAGTAFVVVRQSESLATAMVWSASSLAQNRGVFPGMPLHILTRTYPDIPVFLHDPAHCEKLALEFKPIFERYTPDHTINTHGHGLLNLTNTPLQRTQKLQEIGAIIYSDIVKHTDICQITLGIASSILMARILARRVRPEGILIETPETRTRYFEQLAISDLPHVSTTVCTRLNNYGITTVHQLKSLSSAALLRRFGREGERLYALAHGLDAREQKKDASLKAVTVLSTDINDTTVLHQMVNRTVDQLCYLLRNARVQVLAVRIEICFTDNKKSQRTTSFAHPSHNFLMLTGKITKTFTEMYTRRIGIKSITLVASRTTQSTGQCELFVSQHELKQERLSESIQSVRNTFAFDTIFTAAEALASAKDRS